MEDFDIKPIIEGIIFTSESPIQLRNLVEILPEFDKEVILNGIERIKKECEEDSRGLELVEVAGGYLFRTKPRLAQWVNRFKKRKPVKLSQSALETLAIIAYRQPIIKPTIDEIRGVDSGWVLRTLLERGLVRILGRKDIPGRPVIYGTTQAFLELFSLNTLSDLPSLKEIQPPSMPEELSKEEISEVDKEKNGNYQNVSIIEAKEEGEVGSN